MQVKCQERKTTENREKRTCDCIDEVNRSKKTKMLTWKTQNGSYSKEERAEVKAGTFWVTAKSTTGNSRKKVLQGRLR